MHTSLFILKMIYGMFLVGVESAQHRMCLVQLMQSMAGVVNNLDCPLYTVTERYSLVPSTAVQVEVSFVHQCDKSCHYVESRSVVVEREEVALDRLQFAHNFETNPLYCLNVFCMNQ